MAPRAGTRGGRGVLRSRARRADEGAAAAEFAMVMPALVLIIGIVVGAGAIGATQLRAMDAARAAAREIARGEVQTEVIAQARKTAGDAARVTIEDDDGYAEVTVEVPLPDSLAPVLESVTASATARREG
ncbi:TadE family type IV pilus minor pilin [Brevibacterium senegalense]|uniref:TadE family type IV pilus minor pilin n=1 Tax=Brevibacterium senegalense TaxID=1033736 RepID=UPI0002DC98DE|nr:TadE family type IV pilus minor pilin [Brevibacterium senegalense]